MQTLHIIVHANIVIVFVVIPILVAFLSLLQADGQPGRPLSPTTFLLFLIPHRLA
jgi:hypothetical protein